jgi:hypothetical protein
VDLAKAARTIVRWLLTVGAAIAFFVMVIGVCMDVWEGSDKVEVGTVYAAVAVSLSVTFGSGFIGWFGLSSASVAITVKDRANRRDKLWAFTRGVFTTLVGAALLAMLLYLIAGAIAGATYLGHEDETPGMLVTIATAWAAQASVVIASTLATALNP